MRLRLGLGFTKGGGRFAFAVAFTGLSTDSLGSYGLIGNHAAISYTITPDLTTETVKWSNSSNPAAAATFGTGASPTDFVSVDGFDVWLHVTDDPGDGPVTRSFRFPARITPATAAGAIAAQTWTVDDTTVNLNAATDYTANGNTLTYTASGLPAGVTINGAGTISGTPTAVLSGSVVVTATDAYGRLVTSTFTQATSLRTQATAAGALGPYSLARNVAISATNLALDFTANGNTLTYAMVAALPSALVVSSAGSMTGTPAADAASASYTVRATDEYGRQTNSVFSLSVAFNPVSIFAASEDGGWYEPSDLTTMWQDVSATVQMTTAGQTCAQMDDKSGNANHATQGTLAARMALSGTGPYYLNPDRVDDNFSIPLGASFVGDFCLVLNKGPIFGSINTGADTTWLYTKNPIYIPDGNIHALIVVNRALTAGEKTDLVAYYAAGVTSNPTTAAESFRARTDITALDFSYDDWTSVTSAVSTFLDCTSLTTVNVSGWTGIASAVATFQNCTGLTTTPDVSGWTGVTSAAAVFFSCTGLTTTPNVSGWTGVTNASFAFFSCSGLTNTPDVSGWTGVTNAWAAFFGCTGLTAPPNVSGWTGVTNAEATFQFCTGLTTSVDISTWNPTILTTGAAMMNGISAAGFTQAQYEAALAAWDAGYDLTTVNTLAIDFGSAKYGAGAPATTRALLVTEGWTIADGGPA